MNNKGSSKTTKKSVSYQPIPSKDPTEIDEEEDPGDDSLSEGYRLVDVQAAAQDSVNIDRRGIHFDEKHLKNEKSSRSKYTTLSGHRRAESLGNVGQTRRHWSPPSFFMETEKGDGNNRLNQGIVRIIKERGNLI